MYSFFSNNCLGSEMFKKFNMQYNNPFIGSFFLDESHFFKLISNLNYYFSLEPQFSIPPISSNKYYQLNNSVFYKYRDKHYKKETYPIMILGDIHIHWIHEDDPQILLEKYKRRRQRYLDSPKKNIVIMSYRECFIDFQDFANQLKNLNFELILFGPPKLNLNPLIKLIPDDFDRDSNKRTYYLLFEGHNLGVSITNIYNYLISNNI